MPVPALEGTAHSSERRFLLPRLGGSLDNCVTDPKDRSHYLIVCRHVSFILTHCASISEKHINTCTCV